jgi:hypothetical protein
LEVTVDNVRIRSKQFPSEDGGSFFVDVERDDARKSRMDYVLGILHDMQKDEPGYSWALQTRGTDSTWHWWQE